MQHWNVRKNGKCLSYFPDGRVMLSNYFLLLLFFFFFTKKVSRRWAGSSWCLTFPYKRKKKNVFLIMLLFCQSTNYLDLNIMGLLTRLAFQNPRLSKTDSKGGSNLAQRPVHHNIDGQRSDTIGMQRRSGYSSLIQSSRPILPWFLFWFCQSFPSQTLS